MRAYIQFKNTQDAYKLYKYLKLSKCNRVKIKCFKVKDPNIKKKMITQNYYPKVKPSIPSENILWFNLQYTVLNRCFRRFLMIVASIILMIASLALIVYAKSYEQSLSD